MFTEYALNCDWPHSTYGWVLGTYLRRAKVLTAEDVVHLNAVFENASKMSLVVGLTLMSELAVSLCRLVDEVPPGTVEYTFEDYLKQIAAST